MKSYIICREDGKFQCLSSLKMRKDCYEYFFFTPQVQRYNVLIGVTVHFIGFLEKME